MNNADGKLTDATYYSYFDAWPWDCTVLVSRGTDVLAGWVMCRVIIRDVVCERKDWCSRFVPQSQRLWHTTHHRLFTFSDCPVWYLHHSLPCIIPYPLPVEGYVHISTVKREKYALIPKELHIKWKFDDTWSFVIALESETTWALLAWPSCIQLGLHTVDRVEQDCIIDCKEWKNRDSHV